MTEEVLNTNPRIVIAYQATENAHLACRTSEGDIFNAEVSANTASKRLFERQWDLDKFVAFYAVHTHNSKYDSHCAEIKAEITKLKKVLKTKLNTVRALHIENPKLYIVRDRTEAELVEVEIAEGVPHNSYYIEA